MAPMSMTFSDLDGHFYFLKSFKFPCLGIYSTYRPITYSMIIHESKSALDL